MCWSSLFIGYEPIEYKLTAADTNLKVRFTDSSELLDEVVVVGYGVQKKSVLFVCCEPCYQ